MFFFGRGATGGRVGVELMCGMSCHLALSRHVPLYARAYLLWHSLDCRRRKKTVRRAQAEAPCEHEEVPSFLCE